MWNYKTIHIQNVRFFLIYNRIYYILHIIKMHMLILIIMLLVQLLLFSISGSQMSQNKK